MSKIPYLRDLSRIPVNKGIESRLGSTKYSDLYEIVNLSVNLIFLCLLTGAECKKALVFNSILIISILKVIY